MESGRARKMVRMAGQDLEKDLAPADRQDAAEGGEPVPGKRGAKPSEAGRRSGDGFDAELYPALPGAVKERPGLSGAGS
jgi:hypothetical protein